MRHKVISPEMSFKQIMRIEMGEIVCFIDSCRMRTCLVFLISRNIILLFLPLRICLYVCYGMITFKIKNKLKSKLCTKMFNMKQKIQAHTCRNSHTHLKHTFTNRCLLSSKHTARLNQYKISYTLIVDNTCKKPYLYI